MLARLHGAMFELSIEAKKKPAGPVELYTVSLARGHSGLACGIRYLYLCCRRTGHRQDSFEGVYLCQNTAPDALEV